MNFARTIFSKILICYVNVIFSVIFDINKTIFFLIIYHEQTTNRRVLFHFAKLGMNEHEFFLPTCSDLGNNLIRFFRVLVYFSVFLTNFVCIFFLFFVTLVQVRWLFTGFSSKLSKLS